MGSSKTRVVVGEFITGEKNPKIIGVGESDTRGMRHGYVVDSRAVTNSIKNAVELAEKTSQVKIKRAFVSVGGISLKGENSTGSAIVSKADGEVTTLDLNKALEDCEDNLNLSNKKIIQVFPTSYRLDGKEVFGRIEGMHGTKIEARALAITYSMQHLEDLISALAMAGVETMDIIASPLSASQIALSEKQKIAGVGLVNIGSETVSLSIFENGSLTSLHTFSFGSNDITNDIALGLKIPLDLAEKLKHGTGDDSYSKKKLEEIIEARLSDILELIENYLKKIKRSGLLPAGVVFVGGGANTSGLEELSKNILKLPSNIGSTEIFNNSKTKLRDSTWFTALGLLTLGREISTYGESSFSNFIKDLKNSIKATIKQLMP